jgi:hypothetical protein
MSKQLIFIIKMEKIRKIIKERTGGFFLIFLAVLIIFGVSLNSRRAESKNEQNLVAEEQAPIEEQILGETDNNPGNAMDNSEEAVSDVNSGNSSSENAGVSGEKNASDPKADAYNNLKNSFKKYCDKSGSDNKKKCKKYCSQVKDISKGNDKYYDLYKKYCDKKKEGEKKNSTVSAETTLTLNFIVNSLSGTEKFSIEFKEGETVYELMKEAKVQEKLAYEKNTDETYGVYINEINGLKEGSDSNWTKNNYWILYVNGKSSNVGCSNHKLNKADTSIEWKYEKYSF